MVIKLDWLARSVADLIRIILTIERKGAGFAKYKGRKPIADAIRQEASVLQERGDGDY